MAGSTTTHYTARLLMPDLLERARDNVISCPVYLNGSLVAPNAGTDKVSVYDADNVAVVDAAAITNTNAVATYTIPAATLPATLSLGEGWRVAWSLTSIIASPFRNDAALVRERLFPVITDADLFRRVNRLNPARKGCITKETHYQDYIDEAWAWIQLKLIEQGNRPNLISSPSAFREVHLNRTLFLIFDNLANHNNNYQAAADKFEEKADTAWGTMSFIYHEKDEEKAETPQRRKKGKPTVLLNSPPTVIDW